MEEVPAESEEPVHEFLKRKAAESAEEIRRELPTLENFPLI